MTVDTTNYGTVTGYLGTVIGDTAFDVDDNPDNVPAVGSVTFTPNVKWIQNSGLGVLLPQKVTCPLVNGWIASPDGNTSKLFVKLFPTDDPKSNPINWTYTVNIVLTGLGAASIPAFDISVPSGATIDLKNVIPAASSPGISVATAVGLANQAAQSAAAAAASLAAGGGGGGGSGSTTVAGITDATVLGKNLLLSVDQSAAKLSLGLDQVSNTSDVNKPVSTATAASISTGDTALAVQISDLQVSFSSLTAQLAGVLPASTPVLRYMVKVGSTWQPRPVTLPGVPVIVLSPDGSLPPGSGTEGGGAGIVDGLDVVLLGPTA